MICPHHGGTSPRKSGGSLFSDGPRVTGRSPSTISNPMGRELCWFCSFSKPHPEHKQSDCSPKHKNLGRGARDFLYPAKSHTRRKPERTVKSDGRYDHLHRGVAAAVKQLPASLRCSSPRPVFDPQARATTASGIPSLANPLKLPTPDGTLRIPTGTPRPPSNTPRTSGSAQIDRSTAASRNRAHSEDREDHTRLLHSERPHWGPRVPSTGRTCTPTPYKNPQAASSTADSGGGKQHSHTIGGTPREKVDALRALQSATAFLHVDHELASTKFLKTHLERTKQVPMPRTMTSVASEPPRDGTVTYDLEHTATVGAMESPAAEDTAAEGGNGARRPHMAGCARHQRPEPAWCAERQAGPPFGHLKADDASSFFRTRHARNSGTAGQTSRHHARNRAGVEPSWSMVPRLAMRLQLPVRGSVASSERKKAGSLNLMAVHSAGSNQRASEGAGPQAGSSPSAAGPSLRIGMVRSQAATRLHTAASRTTDGSAQQRPNTSADTHSTSGGDAHVPPDYWTSVTATQGEPQAVDEPPQQGVITLHGDDSVITFHGNNSVITLHGDGGLARKEDAASEVKKESAVVLESESTQNGRGCGGSTTETDVELEEARQSARVLLRYPGASLRFVENMLKFLRKRRADEKAEKATIVSGEITRRRSQQTHAVTSSIASPHTSPINLTATSTSAASISPQSDKRAAGDAAGSVRFRGRTRSAPAVRGFTATTTTTTSQFPCPAPSCTAESQRSFTLLDPEKTTAAQTIAPGGDDTFVLHVPHTLSPTIRSHIIQRPARSSTPPHASCDDHITKSSQDTLLPRDVSDDGINVAEGAWTTATSSQVELTAKDEECTAGAGMMKQDTAEQGVALKPDDVSPQVRTKDLMRAWNAQERGKPRFFSYALPSKRLSKKKK
eukprot:GEMP01007801.1.p1 GENE.GEMP01007801.1~~GEMP01007801.1.p1  ORF type:complete len:912 (+),score=251.87 GEMP01007801.1:37-2736(+)